MEDFVTFQFVVAGFALLYFIAKGVNPGVLPASVPPHPSVRAPAQRRATPPSPTYVDDRGYVRFISSNRLVHRVVAEQKLGRRLRPEEVVHHRDRNKQNNVPGNLWVFKNQAEHDAQHRRDAEKYGEWWSYNGSVQRN